MSTYNHSGSLQIIPLGGVGEFGMNMTAYIHDKRLFVVDCGIKFSDPDRLGTDGLFPDIRDFFTQFGGPFAYFITHGHEDHIGAIAQILPLWPKPVYGTPWTIALIKNKLIRHGVSPDSFRLIEVEPGDLIRTEGFEVEWVHINHSIPMACSLVIRTDHGTVYHSGDFKFDKDPILEEPYDKKRLLELADEGIDLVLADSTNAEKSGYCPGEKSINAPLAKVIKSCDGAVIITTFASNLERLMTVIQVTKAAGRKLYITGRGIDNTLSIANSLNIYTPPPGVVIGDSEVKGYPKEKLVILATGCQGEWKASLARMANEEHRFFKPGPGDTVLFSSRSIPGNEKSIQSIIDKFVRLGVKVMSQRDVPEIHVSGHAYGGELEELVSTLRPKYFVPIHGGHSQLHANGSRMEGGPEVSMFESGNILTLNKKKMNVLEGLDMNILFVDAQSSVVLTPEELRGRLKIGELGLALISGVYDKSGRWLVEPDIELIGLKLPRHCDEEKWFKSAKKQIEKEFVRGLKDSHNEANDAVRISFRQLLSLALNKKPVVKSNIHVVNTK